MDFSMDEDREETKLCKPSPKEKSNNDNSMMSVNRMDDSMISNNNINDDFKNDDVEMILQCIQDKKHQEDVTGKKVYLSLPYTRCDMDIDN